MLDTIRCPLCHNYMANIETPNGKPALYCGVCRYGFLLVSREGQENLSKSCERIEESQLPGATLDWYKKKVESGQ